jgi:hypothetical protein
MRFCRGLLGLAALAACDRPTSRIHCHNGNCVEPVKAERDNTLAALTDSLALTTDRGVPILDGVEIDLFWRAADSMCLFAHDLDAPRSELASQAADVIAAHLAEPGAATHSGGPLRVFIELKSHVGVEKSERHTPEQRVLHAQCAWGVYTTIANAALASGKQVDFAFAAFNPDLLRTMIDTAPAAPPFPYAFESFYGVPRPLDSETRPLGDYAGVPITIIELHAQWIHDAQYEALIGRDIEIGLFMFSATVETLDAIEQYEPSFISTNEARFIRRWLDR